MNKTEKKYWINGIQKRGKNFYTLTMSLFNLGLMISGKKIPTKLTFYRLVKKLEYKTIQDCIDSDNQGLLN